MLDTAVYPVNGNYTITLAVSNTCGADTLRKNLYLPVNGCDNSVGISNYTQGIDVYPNPVENALNIVLTARNTAEVEVMLLDMRGRAVLYRQINQIPSSGKLQLSTRQFRSGVYLLEVVDGTKRYRQKIFVE